jgi:GNAT superfamily N-acetyltransferase
VRVRPAREADVPLLLGLIGELAEYEKLVDEAVGTEELVREHLFGERPVAEAAIAELVPEGGGEPEPVGYVLWYTTFSTFQCLPGAWVEDLFVRPEHRGGGTGRELLAHVAKVAVERGYGRMELTALDWNEPALGFYRALGAQSMNEWVTQRFEGEALAALARPA